MSSTDNEPEDNRAVPPQPNGSAGVPPQRPTPDGAPAAGRPLPPPPRQQGSGQPPGPGARPPLPPQGHPQQPPGRGGLPPRQPGPRPAGPQQQGPGSPALNRGRRRAAVDRRLSRVGACRRRGRDSRCDPARARFPSSSVRRRCSPVRPQIVRREPIPHAGCSPVRRTARNRRHSGSPRRGQLPRLVRPVVPPRADRRRHLPRVDPVAEPAVVAGSGESHGA